MGRHADIQLHGFVARVRHPDVLDPGFHTAELVAAFPVRPCQQVLRTGQFDDRQLHRHLLLRATHNAAHDAIRRLLWHHQQQRQHGSEELEGHPASCLPRGARPGGLSAM